jgi:hypothetical protein
MSNMKAVVAREDQVEIKANYVAQEYTGSVNDYGAKNSFSLCQ